MIEDGIQGVEGTPGFLAYFNGDAGINWDVTPSTVGEDKFWAGNMFAAARVYNKGNIVSEDLTVQSEGGKNTYANDVAARLWGWDGKKGGCEMSKSCPGLGFEGRSC